MEANGWKGRPMLESHSSLVIAPARVIDAAVSLPIGTSSVPMQCPGFHVCALYRLVPPCTVQLPWVLYRSVSCDWKLWYDPAHLIRINMRQSLRTGSTFRPTIWNLQHAHDSFTETQSKGGAINLRYFMQGRAGSTFYCVTYQGGTGSDIRSRLIKDVRPALLLCVCIYMWLIERMKTK